MNSLLHFQLCGSHPGFDDGAVRGPFMLEEIDGEGQRAGVLGGASDDGAGALLRGAADIAQLRGADGGGEFFFFGEPGVFEELRPVLVHRGEVAQDGFSI